MTIALDKIVAKQLLGFGMVGLTGPRVVGLNDASVRGYEEEPARGLYK